MKIEWMGHASFLLTLSSGARLCTDPYEAGSYDGAVGYDEIGERVDFVTISHQHEDHNCTDQLRGDFKVFKQIGEFEESGIRVTGYPSYHDDSHGSERGENIMFKIETEGLSVLHLGDLGHILSEEDVEKLGKVDVMLIPVGGYFTIDASQAWKIVEQIGPRVVVPMHYKTEKLGFPIAGVGEFLSLTEDVEHQEELELDSGSMKQGTRVVVLKHKR